MRKTPGLWASVLLVLMVPVVSGAGTLTLAPLRDNTLFLDQDGLLSSGSGTGLFVGNNSVSNTRRAVLFFDVAGELPPDAVIESVELLVYVSSLGAHGTSAVKIFRLTNSWGEGASVSSGGAGGSSEPGDATWIHRFFPDTPWAAPGGDFDPQERAAVDIGDFGPVGFSSPGLVADVQSWLDQPEANLGWILVGDETVPSTVKRIDSREHSKEANRPILRVTFSSSSTPTIRTTWGRLKDGKTISHR